MNPNELLRQSETDLEKCINFWEGGNYKGGRKIALDALERLQKYQADISEHEFREMSARIYFMLSNIEREAKSYELSRYYINITKGFYDITGTEKQKVKINTNIGLLEEKLGNFSEAHRLFTEQLAYWEKVENPEGIADAKLNLGLIAFDVKDYDLAHRYHMEAREIYQELGMSLEKGKVFYNESNLNKNIGRNQLALSGFCDGLRLFSHHDNKLEICLSITGIACVVLEKVPETSLRLLGFCEKFKKEFLLPDEEEEIALVRLREIFEEDKFNSLFEDGKNMEIYEAIALALNLKNSVIFE